MVKQRVQSRYFKWVHSEEIKVNNKQELKVSNEQIMSLQYDSISEINAKVQGRKIEVPRDVRNSKGP